MSEFNIFRVVNHYMTAIGFINIPCDVSYREFDNDSDGFEYYGIIAGTYAYREYEIFGGYIVRQYLCDGVWDELPYEVNYVHPTITKQQIHQHRKIEYRKSFDYDNYVRDMMF